MMSYKPISQTLVITLFLVLAACGSGGDDSSNSSSSSSTSSSTGSSSSSSTSSSTSSSSTSNSSSSSTSSSASSSSSSSTSSSSSSGVILPNPNEDINPTSMDAGFTEFFQSEDTVVYYVSEEGDDTNSGLTKELSLRTAQKALGLVRTGFPDWILFRRGDTFASMGRLSRSGRSANEPLVLGSYGESSERPIFTGSFYTNGGGGAPISTDYISLVGLKFYNSKADPTSVDFDGSSPGSIGWLRGTKSLWIEDCVFQYMQVNIQGGDGEPQENITLFRSQFLDNYGIGHHAQGLYIDGPTNLVIDESLFDHNGWAEDLAGAGSTIFNHNIYVQNGSGSPLLRNSILMRASSHGVQFRPGGIISGNFFFRNPINALIGGGDNPEPGGVDGLVQDNVILDGVDMPSGGGRGAGIDLENIKSANIEGNIIADCNGSLCKNISSGVSGTTYSENFIQNWPGGFTSEPGPTPATLLDYAMSIEIDSLDEFYSALRQQSRSNWRSELTTTEINSYFQTELLD